MQAQAPQAMCTVALSLDRKIFIDILGEGQGSMGRAMLPPPARMWGLTPEMLQELPGYGPDIEKNRAEARGIMEKFGYGPDTGSRSRCRPATLRSPATWR